MLETWAYEGRVRSSAAPRLCGRAVSVVHDLTRYMSLKVSVLPEAFCVELHTILMHRECKDAVCKFYALLPLFFSSCHAC